MRLRSIVLSLLALGVLAGVFLGGRGLRSRVVERETDIVLPPEPTPPAPPSPPREGAPAVADVREALDRVFDETLIVDESVRPPAVTGDFNGDGQHDVAAAVRPRDLAALSRLNADLPPWRVQDASAQDSARETVRPTLTAGELVLAVVHGVDGGGWRSPGGMQGYLVKNAVGSGMRPRPLAGVPDGVRMRLNRPHAGDAIAAQRGDDAGLILWTGAAYAWAPRPPTGRGAPSPP